MPSLFLSKRELIRAWQILTIIGRYGLMPLTQMSGIGAFLGVRIWQRMDRRLEDVSPPVRLRLALTELGTTFIKLGQVLSARSDLLPPEYLTELSRLQDAVPPLPFDRVEPVFRTEFGVEPATAYQEFDTVPFASASIGQAYRATLHDGTPVVVKIQRPGVSAQVQTDLALLRRVAQFLHGTAQLHRFDFPAVVREFGSILQDELLYTLEAYNAETLTDEMADRPGVEFPAVYWPLTSRQVLTTQYVSGHKITDHAWLETMGIDRSALAVTLANSLLEQILLFGMFHGDPHPGNLLVTPEGRLVFLDTGMVGRFDRKTRELLIELAIAIFDQDIDAILLHLQQLGVVEDVTNPANLRRDLARLFTKYYFLPRREFRLGELLQRMNSLLFEHHIRMAYEFSLMTKSLFIAEGIALQLDPQFDYNRAALPVINEIRRRYYSPELFLEDTVRELRGLRRQIVDLPRRLSTALTHFERGTFRVESIDALHDARLGAENILINRISIAMLAIGILIASALLLAAHPSGWMLYLALGGIAISVLFMAYCILALLRSGRI